MKKIGFLHEYEGGYFRSWSDFIIIIMAVICLKLVMKY